MYIPKPLTSELKIPNIWEQQNKLTDKQKLKGLFAKTQKIVWQVLKRCTIIKRLIFSVVSIVHRRGLALFLQ